MKELHAFVVLKTRPGLEVLRLTKDTAELREQVCREAGERDGSVLLQLQPCRVQPFLSSRDTLEPFWSLSRLQSYTHLL